MVLSTADVSNFKQKYGVIVICTNCQPLAAQDKTLPRNSYLIRCQDGEDMWYDIAMGSRSDIFDAYYDRFGDVMKRMEWTEGRINPKLWGSQVKESKKKK
jgi:hypothetical protein